MPKNISSLKAEPREERGKEQIKKLRKEGRIPAVVYGAEKGPVSLAINEHEFKILTVHNLGDVVLLNLETNDGSEKVFIREVQKDPVSDKPIHVDFFRVDLSAPVTMAVRINEIGGTPEGVRLGGVVERLRYMVNVKALPEKIPAHIDADLSKLDLNEVYYVSQLPRIEGVEYMDSPTTALFGCKAKGKGVKGAEKDDAPEAAVADPAAVKAAAAKPAAGKPAAAKPAGKA